MNTFGTKPFIWYLFDVKHQKVATSGISIKEAVSYMYEFRIRYLNGMHFVATVIATKVYFIFEFVSIWIFALS